MLATVGWEITKLEESLLFRVSKKLPWKLGSWLVTLKGPLQDCCLQTKGESRETLQLETRGTQRIGKLTRLMFSKQDPGVELSASSWGTWEGQLLWIITLSSVSDFDAAGAAVIPQWLATPIHSFHMVGERPNSYKAWHSLPLPQSPNQLFTWAVPNYQIPAGEVRNQSVMKLAGEKPGEEGILVRLLHQRRKANLSGVLRTF